MTRLRKTLWAVAGLLFVIVVFQAFVGGLYPVGSSSMAPTLLPGDHVLVLYGSSIPDRGTVVVVHGTEPNPLVKRAVGLPGDELAITSDGDLRINRAYYSGGFGASPGVLLFDSERCGFEEHFDWPEKGAQSTESVSTSSTQRPPVKSIALDGRGVNDGEAVPSMSLLHGIHDGYLDGTGHVRFGNEEVGDARIAFHLSFLDEAGTAVFQLSDKSELFEVTLEWRAGEVIHGVLQRLTLGGNELVVQDREEFQLAAGVEPICLELHNFDNEVFLASAGVRLAGFQSSGFSQAEGDHPDIRVRLGVTGTRMEVSQLRIWRDLHYTARGRFGVDRSVRLEPDELFLLGDNSAHSTDSREYGPVKREHLIGRAAWIVWPLSRFGRVGGASGPQNGDCDH